MNTPEPDLIDGLYFALSGAVELTAITCDTTATALVPRPGHHLEIFNIWVSTPETAATAVGDVFFVDGTT